MRSLHDLQVAFTEALLNPESDRCGDGIRANGLSGSRRLQVYRNNVFANLTDALRAVYPVIHRLGGEDFFRLTAREYIHDHPSTSGNLHEFGDRFAEFMQSFPGAAGLLYLPDVARLEWAYHLVFHAAEEGPLDPACLAAIPRERWCNLKFKLNPASCLLVSEYPILRIWQVNQTSHAGDRCVDLHEGGVRVLVIRRQLEVELRPLALGEYTLLQALANGQDLSRALATALDSEVGFDLSSTLQRHAAIGTLSECDV